MNDKHMEFTNTFVGQNIFQDRSIYKMYASGVVDSHPFWLCHRSMQTDYDGFPDWVMDR